MNSVVHFCVGFFLRLAFIFYSEVHDDLSVVQFTDIDYKVFTDAARNILEGKSVYEHCTYRYSPVVALLLTPNILLHPAFGKILFSVCDILITFLIQKILYIDGFNTSESLFYSLLWLYNPLSIIISTRGNMDSIGALLVLFTLLACKKKNYIYAGILHGFSIHFRLYPIVFSLSMYMSIKDKHKNYFINYIYPNKNRIILTLSCILTLLTTTYICFYIYGSGFVNESILYHIKRKDIRHNYSVYFYAQYLGIDYLNTYTKIFLILPQVLLLLIFSFMYSSLDHLPFCELCLSFVLVSFNSVLTCQYFIWYLCLLPVCIPHVKCNKREAAIVSCVWLIAQIAWLYPAYKLEFKSANTYFEIWIHGLLFFCANMLLLGVLLKSYSFNCKKKLN